MYESDNCFWSFVSLKCIAQRFERSLKHSYVFWYARCSRRPHIYTNSRITEAAAMSASAATMRGKAASGSAKAGPARCTVFRTVNPMCFQVVLNRQNTIDIEDKKAEPYWQRVQNLVQQTLQSKIAPSLLRSRLRVSANVCQSCFCIYY